MYVTIVDQIAVLRLKLHYLGYKEDTYYERLIPKEDGKGGGGGGEKGEGEGGEAPWNNKVNSMQSNTIGESYGRKPQPLVLGLQT